MIKLFSLALVVLSLCAGPAFAQNETAVLTGRVVDPSGLGVGGAQIRLTEQATGAVRNTLTLTEGVYRFDLLPPGDYSVRVTATASKPSRIRESTWRSPNPLRWTSRSPSARSPSPLRSMPKCPRWSRPPSPKAR